MAKIINHINEPDFSAVLNRHLFIYLWQLACIANPICDRRGFGRRIEYFFRLIPYLYWVSQLRKIFSDKELSHIIYLYPALMDRSRRPFLDRRWSAEKRVLVMESHYQWLKFNFSLCYLNQIYQQQGLVVASIPTEKETYSLKLHYDRLFDKEGDLMLSVVGQSNESIGTLSFSIYNDIIWVGGIQGGEGGLDNIRKATKDFEGLRPLALLLIMMQLLAQKWFLQDVKAISDECHIYQHWRYRRNHCIHRSYNKLWQELSGVEQQGWFSLGVTPIKRCVEDIPARKRAMYKRRYKMLEDIQVQLLSFSSKK